MYSFIHGKILSIDGISVTALVEGIGLGLEIYVSPHLLANVRIGESVDIWTHHHITDAGQTLFGFIDQDEKKLFRELLKVNGVGGKTALNLLGLGGENLMRAIQLEDDKLLSSVPGIGKKTAQKIIVDLKGSIDFSKKSNPNQQTSKPANQPSHQLLISSLIQMGYDKTRVEAVVSGLDPSVSLEVRTVEAIKSLSK